MDNYFEVKFSPISSLTQIFFCIKTFCKTSGRKCFVAKHFFSNKTSFSEQKEKITDFPVIFVSFRRSASEFNLSDVKIRYYATGIADWPYLEIGKNDLFNDRYDKNESVIFESIENQWNSKSFRIIHASPILEKNMAKVEIQIEHNVEH